MAAVVELHHQAGLDLRRQHRASRTSVELGNTQTASYIAGGAFADLTTAKGQFENSASWLQGLTDSGTSPDGKLEAVPYYAGSRVVIYRKDLLDQGRRHHRRRPRWTS